MIHTDLLHYLESVLGPSKRSSGDNFAFFSPFTSHHKPKLEINLSVSDKNIYRWHCWITDTGGSTIHSLLRKMEVGRDEFERLSKVLNTKYYVYSEDSHVVKKVELRLPKEFIPLYKSLDNKKDEYSIQYAKRWLYKRGLNDTDIARYQIGYCDNGEYGGRIIIPSYDSSMRLNFFTGRSVFPEDSMKYKNPYVSKDIIGFENTINWSQDVYLVEGVFDAITLRKNAIPLFGKSLSKKLESKLLTDRPPVWVCLDMDAERESIRMASNLIKRGLSVHRYTSTSKDISEAGFDKTWVEMRKVPPYSESNLLKDRIMSL